MEDFCLAFLFGYFLPSVEIGGTFNRIFFAEKNSVNTFWAPQSPTPDLNWKPDRGVQPDRKCGKPDIDFATFCLWTFSGTTKFQHQESQVLRLILKIMVNRIGSKVWPIVLGRAVSDLQKSWCMGQCHTECTDRPVENPVKNTFQILHNKSIHLFILQLPIRVWLLTWNSTDTVLFLQKRNSITRKIRKKDPPRKKRPPLIHGKTWFHYYFHLHHIIYCMYWNWNLG